MSNTKKTNCRLDRTLRRNRFRGAKVAAVTAAVLLVPVSMAFASLSQFSSIL